MMRRPMDSKEQFFANGVSTNSGAFQATNAPTFDLAELAAASYLLTWAGSNLAGLGWQSMR